MADSKATGKAADTSKAEGANEGAGESRKVLTEGMIQPPGVIERKRRVRRERRKGPFVKYVGAASHRTITPTEWKATAGVGKDNLGKNPDTTHAWTTKNDYMIESDQFSDAQLDYLLIDDMQIGTGAHSFLEVDYDDQGQLVQVLDEEE